MSRELCKKIYKVSNVGLFAKDFELRGQIRASSGSMMDNIAEGFERGGRREFCMFLGIAKGSTGEVKSQLYRALDIKYISQEEFDELFTLADDIGKVIAGLINYLNTTTIRGIRYKKSQATNSKQ